MKIQITAIITGFIVLNSAHVFNSVEFDYDCKLEKERLQINSRTKLNADFVGFRQCVSMNEFYF